MNYAHRTDIERYRDGFLAFSSIERWKNPFAVTLTLKQQLEVEVRSCRIRIPITKETASQNFGHFMNLLNRKVLGKRFSRFGERIRVIPVIEGGFRKRLHIHAVIDCPRDDLRDSFPTAIREAWSHTRWGYWQADIQADADLGWIEYISKTRDKPSYADAIDWMNYHNPD